MNYHLSNKLIVKTMRAMAALESLAGDEEPRGVLAPLMCKEREGLTGEMVRNAFVETVMALGPMVADMDMGDGSDDCDMSVELITPRGMSGNCHTVVRHALEQTVAVTALWLWCGASVSRSRSEEVASVLEENFRLRMEGTRRKLGESLAGRVYPAMRGGGFGLQAE